MDDAQADEINDAVRLLAIRHRARATQLLATAGVGIGQEMLLFQLADGEQLTQAQLAVGARCEPPTVTVAVRKLEAAGLVQRVRSTTDSRAILVSLTDEGRALMPRLRELWRQLAEETVADLPVRDRGALVRLARQASAGLA